MISRPKQQAESRGAIREASKLKVKNHEKKTTAAATGHDFYIFFSSAVFGMNRARVKTVDLGQPNWVEVAHGRTGEMRTFTGFLPRLAAETRRI